MEGCDFICDSLGGIEALGELKKKAFSFAKLRSGFNLEESVSSGKI
jgi:hypothetical protein